MFEETYTFDDVLIKPAYSEIKSRSDVDLSVNLSKGIKLKIPVMPANMKTIVNEAVAEEFYKLGGMCFLHRFMPIEEQLDILINLRNKYSDVFNYIGVSVGVKEEDYKNIGKFVDIGVKLVCIDIAHGHSKQCGEFTYYIAKKYPSVFLVAGNVATSDGAVFLWGCGADMVKVGIGGGAICSTRIATGCGLPQLSAIQNVYNYYNSHYHLSHPNKFIISDGGCAKVGDIVKSLVFSDMVMMGNMFSGTIETPGTIIEMNGKQYKRYDGSSTHKSDHIEGVKAMVETKGPIKDVIKQMTDGISSGCSYVGAPNLKELRERAKFVRITNAGVRENGSHDVLVVKGK